jgi:type VI secretion system protein ImpH
MMPAFGWKTDRSVEDWLYAEPYRFDFFQAVRILESLNPDAVSVGEGSEPEKEAVRFRSRVGLDFPASEVQTISPPALPGEPADMTINFLGVAGAFGPLTHGDTEHLMERIRAKDYTMRDFLDIFNHRLISLLYQVRKLHRVALTTQSPENTPVARYLFSLFGLGLQPLRNRMNVDDRVLLYSAGILSQQPRSAAGLERLLTRHFGVGAQVHQLIGRWRELGSDQWTRIGRRGQQQRLGDTAALGTRIWDQQGAFEVRLGPLTLSQFRDFLPSGTAWTPLCELTRFFVGMEFQFAFRFTLKAAEVPAMRLGQARLGWTSWLKVREFASDDSQACVRLA